MHRHSFSGAGRSCKVLYIAGYGRSGSTILELILGEFDNIKSVGELRYVWDRGLNANWSCGCGEQFDRCSYWKSVFDLLPEGTNRETIQKMIAGIRPWSRGWLTIKSYLADRGISFQTLHSDLMHMLANLYGAICMTSGRAIIVDSSKWPDYAALLQQAPGIELYLVHLVRDPRAVAFSWRRRRKYEPNSTSDIHTPVYSPVRTAVEWVAWNRAIKRQTQLPASRSIRIRYEDFIANPKGTVAAIFRFLGEPVPNSSPFSGNRTVALHGNHAVSGNPVRFLRGEVPLVLDDEWTHSMGKTNQAVVSMITRPLMREFGYA